MKTGLMAAVAGLAVSGMASAAFVSFEVVSTAVSNSGQSLVRYEVFARFNGPTDTVLNAFNFGAVGGSAASYGGFWHKDNFDSSDPGQLSQTVGTWAPQATGSASANRPFDSFLLIGGNPVLSNSTNADPSWGAALSWNRVDLPSNGTIGWFNSNPPNLQGRVGTAPNTATDVKIGQFILSAGDSAPRTYTLTLRYNDGVPGSAVQFGTGTFSLPAPGAVALLGLAGLAGRRRR